MAEVTDRGENARHRPFRLFRLFRLFRPFRPFRLYPEYRDSSVEWLDSIPAHWGVKRLKFLAPARSSKFIAKADEAVYVGLENVESWTGRLQLESQPASIDSIVSTFSAGDVLFGKLRPYLAKAARPDFDGVCTSEILALQPGPGSVQSYLMYCLLNQPYIRWVDSLTYGAKMPRVSPDQVGDSYCPVPPESEQHAIVAFLDRETAKIDALVARKERLIELLQEKRSALITRAVTRGLDPNVPMKDSGVEWLGEIPAHWEPMPLKRILRRCDYGLSESLVGSGDIRVLTMAHVQDGEIVLPDDGSIDAVDRTLVLESGDLLFNRTNSRELVGKVGIFRGHRRDRVTFASYLVRLTARDNVEAEWLNYLLNSTGLLGMARSMALLSVNQANLNPTKYQRIVVPMPELSEQRRIAGFAKREATRIDTLIRKVRVAIDHLREFRTAVISAAVTGKIDVREAALR